jgi:hypothetical protein
MAMATELRHPLPDAGLLPAGVEPVSDDGELTDLEKLRIGGYMAPALRSEANKENGFTKRKVYVEGKDGSVVRESTLGETLMALSVKHGLAYDVQERTPETTYACIVCAREFAWGRNGPAPRTCEQCRNPKCACGEELKSHTMNPHRIKERGGKPPRCRACSSLERRKPKAERLCACGAVLCRDAMSPQRVAARNGAPAQCRKCAGKSRQKDRTTCACGKELGWDAMSPRNIAARNGSPPRCKACHVARMSERPIRERDRDPRS